MPMDFRPPWPKNRHTIAKSQSMCVLPGPFPQIRRSRAPKSLLALDRFGCSRYAVLTKCSHPKYARVQQFLYLFRIPDDLRVRLKDMPGVTEGELRPLTQMDPMAIRAAVERMAGRRGLAKAC